VVVVWNGPSCLELQIMQKFRLGLEKKLGREQRQRRSEVRLEITLGLGEESMIVLAPPNFCLLSL
jgi:hypothetical protein